MIDLCACFIIDLENISFMYVLNYFGSGCFVAIFTTKNTLQKKRQHDEQYESKGKKATINAVPPPPLVLETPLPTLSPDLLCGDGGGKSAGGGSIPNILYALLHFSTVACSLLSLRVQSLCFVHG
tara:strand:+ start:170 stop:544 length:375 start_codon:yes stop_codon:yes gene_type:complete